VTGESVSDGIERTKDKLHINRNRVQGSKTVQGTQEGCHDRGATETRAALVHCGLVVAVAAEGSLATLELGTEGGNGKHQGEQFFLIDAEVGQVSGPVDDEPVRV
jgi:hypothetical protein